MGNKVAYVDEAFDDAVYVLSAVIADVDGQDCEQLRTLLLGKQIELKFGRENAARRIQLCQTFAGLGLRAIVVVKHSTAPVERRRGLCLVTLAWALDNLVGTIVFDKRQHRGNTHDQTVLKGVASHGPRLEPQFTASHDLPGLWAADIAAGAIFHDLRRANPAYRNALGDTVTVVEA